ncbi:MAG: hypothetical protein MR874_06860 [Coriobacteriaceae bacterium]|uniref:hypothetical protein n=1 Tax=Tractidigestivibacter sp. TaxID=2847320 RepID=UPI002A8017E0|nr:hypothetical protein [Tractidigestivibacter sp.]MCI6548084.1 hypothetical protein [Coriobacteriaceae bacterium]MCI6844462.1 hypothetical protein [Coriobacteriaceae bacterium]MDY4535459.1 hypothetical protein [Tractidigestivibacter sp.]MDY5272156.1 hypothetical protein [Tractidigestivibacter sp.]
MRQEIKASFKQATIKAGTATLQFEVLPSAEGFTEVMKMTGGVVMLTVETEQQELPFEEREDAEGQTTINNYFVNAETGEVTERQDDYLLQEGGE